MDNQPLLVLGPTQQVQAAYLCSAEQLAPPTSFRHIMFWKECFCLLLSVLMQHATMCRQVASVITDLTACYPAPKNEASA